MERIGLEPGTEIGGYRIVHQLGAGAMGVVYRAIDGGGTPVAFKVLQSNVMDRSELRERLVREAAALRKVKHPSVAAMLDVETEADETFIVTELVEGPTLESYVADNGPLPPEELAEVARTLYSALQAVHDAGVVHRDMKPNNVLMGVRGPVLIDFGIAHGMQDPRLTATGLVVGTPGYLAPELVNGAAPSASSDLWGWAAVLTFAATGRAPFGYGGYEAVITRAMAGRPDVDGLDERVAFALRGALSVKPEHRWSPEEVISELELTAQTPGEAPLFFSEQEGQATEVIQPRSAYSPESDTDQTTIRNRPADFSSDPRAIRSHDGRTTVQGTDQGGEGRTAVLPQSSPEQSVMPPAFAPGGAQPAETPSLSGDAGTLDNAQRYQDELDRESGFVDYASRSAFPDHTGGNGLQTAYGTPLDDDGSYVRQQPRHRVGPFLALFVAVLAASMWAPFITVFVFVGLLVIFGIVGTAWDSFHSKRERRGVRKGDTAGAVLLFPWHVIKGLFLFIPSALFTAVVTGAIAGAMYWVAEKGAFGLDWFPAHQVGARIVIVLVAATVYQLLLWYGPLTERTRAGGRLVMQGVFPGAFPTAILVILLLGFAAYASFLVSQGQPTEWWPLQDLPSIGQ